MMHEEIRDTPVLAEVYCPGCHPNRDPLVGITDLRYCENHLPEQRGALDHVVDVRAYLSGSAEAGEDNKAWCDLLHRGDT